MVAAALASREVRRFVADKPLAAEVPDVRSTEQVGIDRDP